MFQAQKIHKIDTDHDVDLTWYDRIRLGAPDTLADSRVREVLTRSSKLLCGGTKVVTLATFGVPCYTAEVWEWAMHNARMVATPDMLLSVGHSKPDLPSELGKHTLGIASVLVPGCPREAFTLWWYPDKTKSRYLFLTSKPGQWNKGYWFCFL